VTGVVRVRPDLLYPCRFTPDLLAQSPGRALLKWDLLAVLPRKMADMALGLGTRKNCPCARVGAMIDLCVPHALDARGLPFAEAEDRRFVQVRLLANSTQLSEAVVVQSRSDRHESVAQARTPESLGLRDRCRPHGRDSAPCFSPGLIATVLREPSAPIGSNRPGGGAFTPACSISSFREHDAQAVALNRNCDARWRGEQVRRAFAW
jgi:hypothetical protein